MAAKHTTRPQLIDAAQRRAYVLEQRKGGMSYRLIAAAARNHFGDEKLPKNYDERYAHDDVVSELRRLHEHNAELASDILVMENARLDQAQAAIWQRVLKGDDKAIDRLLSIMSRRAALNGLDAPKRTDVTSKGEQVQVLVYLPDNGRSDPG